MHPVAVRIPAALHPLTGGETEFTVEADSVGAALAAAGRRHEALLPRILTRGGRLRPYVNVFLDDQDIRLLQGLETPLAGHRTLIVVPSVAGG